MLSRVSLFVQIGDEPNYLHWGLKQMYFGKTFFILTSVYMYACKIKLQTDSSHLQRVRSGRRERQRQRHRERQRHRYRQTKTDRQTVRQAGRQASRQACRQTDSQTEIGRDRENMRDKIRIRVRHSH